MSIHRLSQIAVALVATLSAPLAAQRLQGSKESVGKMYDFAESHHYDFYGTDGAINAAVARGKLVPLTRDTAYTTTSAVGWSYARPETKRFIESFAPRYMAACGAPLTVTSVARPLNHQPHNANPHSVHPTGMAFDIRRPPRGPCLTWLRSALSELEAKGLVEATEEHHPVHLHVAVLTQPGHIMGHRAPAAGGNSSARVGEPPGHRVAASTGHGAARAQADAGRRNAERAEPGIRFHPFCCASPQARNPFSDPAVAGQRCTLPGSGR